MQVCCSALPHLVGSPTHTRTHTHTHTVWATPTPTPRHTRTYTSSHPPPQYDHATELSRQPGIWATYLCKPLPKQLPPPQKHTHIQPHHHHFPCTLDLRQPFSILRNSPPSHLTVCPWVCLVSRRPTTRLPRTAHPSRRACQRGSAPSCCHWSPPGHHSWRELPPAQAAGPDRHTGRIVLLCHRSAASQCRCCAPIAIGDANLLR